MIASVIRDKYLETLEKNKISLKSYDQEKDSDIFKELCGNISQILKSFDETNLENKDSIEIYKTFSPPQLLIDISKSVSIEKMSNINVTKLISADKVTNMDIDVSKSVSTDIISNKIKEFIIEDVENIIPLCYNFNTNNEFKNEVCYIKENSYDLKENHDESSSDHSGDKSTEEITISDMKKEECLMDNNSNSFDNDDCVIVIQQKNKKIDSKFNLEGLLKIKKDFILKIDKLKKRCVKLITEDKFNKIYQLYANNSVNIFCLIRKPTLLTKKT